MSLYRIVCIGPVPRRHQARADATGLHGLDWAIIKRDTEQGEVLLTAAEAKHKDIDLSTIPAARILRQPTAQGAST